MILNTKLTVNRGKIENNPSSYRPSKKEQEAISVVIRDFDTGYQTMNKPYPEFNDKSLLSRMDVDQKAFNSYQEPADDDPDFAWKSRAVRPITRNKIISMAAHLTAAVIYPQIYAQNSNDEDDREAARVMRAIMEWIYDQSEYERTFLSAVIAALVNPAVIVDVEYAEIFRNIKEIGKDGKWKNKKVIDDVLSGFLSSVVPLDELFIADIYESDIQKQPWLIRRKAIDYSIAEAKYSTKQNFKYVKPGIQTIYDPNSGMFYEAYDTNLDDRLVEEIIYYNRSKDLKLVMVNGILITAYDQPNPRKDKLYPFAKGYFEPIDEGKFFYGKSLAFKLANDQEIVNEMYRLVFDGGTLKTMPPQALYGTETLDSTVIIPGAITRFREPNTKLERIDAGGDIGTGITVLNKVESSIVESSQDVTQAGLRAGGRQTAYEIQVQEQNARTMLGLAGKMIAFLVKDWGKLLLSLAVQYVTMAQVNELTDGKTSVTYRNLLVKSNGSDGKKRSQKIEFDLNMPEEMTKEEALNESFSILEREGGLDSDIEIFRVNPSVFRKLKFVLRVVPDQITPPSDALQKALNLELYDRAMLNPLTNKESVTKDILFGSYDKTKGDVSKYMTNPQQAIPQGNAQSTQNPAIGQELNAIQNNNA